LKGLKNWLLFLAMVLIWGSNWSVMKSGLSYVDPLSFVFHRFAFSAASLSPLLVALRGKVPKDKKNLSMLFLLGVISASGVSLTNMGLVHEQSGASAIITYTQPIFVFCMAVPFLNERARASRILGMAIGFLGVVVLSAKQDGFFEGSVHPIPLLLLGALLWALSTVYYKKFLSHIDPIVANTFQLIVSALLLASVNAPAGGLHLPLSSTYLSIVLYASVGASGVALTIWTYLLREEEATILSSSSLIVPMFALVFGWLLLGENVGPRSVIGALLIMTGVYLVNKT